MKKKTVLNKLQVIKNKKVKALAKATDWQDFCLWVNKFLYK